MTRVFHIVFRHESTMRYAKALAMDVRFLPGLHRARRTESSQPMQQQHGIRDEGTTTRTLHGRRVVFTYVSSFPPAGWFGVVHQQLSPRRRVPSSSSTRRKLWLRNMATALVVDYITTTASKRGVMMRKACRGG